MVDTLQVNLPLSAKVATYVLSQSIKMYSKHASPSLLCTFMLIHGTTIQMWCIRDIHIRFLWHHASILASVLPCIMHLTTTGLIQESDTCLTANVL